MQKAKSSSALPLNDHALTLRNDHPLTEELSLRHEDSLTEKLLLRNDHPLTKKLTLWHEDSLNELLLSKASALNLKHSLRNDNTLSHELLATSFRAARDRHRHDQCSKKDGKSTHGNHLLRVDPNQLRISANSVSLTFCPDGGMVPL